MTRSSPINLLLNKLRHQRRQIRITGQFSKNSPQGSCFKEQFRRMRSGRQTAAGFSHIFRTSRPVVVRRTKRRRKVGKCHRKQLIKAPPISYNWICSAIEYTKRSDESQHRIFWKIKVLKIGFTGRIKTRQNLKSETGKMQGGEQDGTVLFRIIASIR